MKRRIALLLIGLLFLGIASAAAQAQLTAVSPAEFADVEAPNAADIGAVPSYRLQQIYGAQDFAHLGGGPHVITRIDWRPGSEMTETISYPSERFTMKFSTTTIDPADTLDREFDRNLGTNQATVFDGATTLTTQNDGAGAGPESF